MQVSPIVILHVTFDHTPCWLTASGSSLAHVVVERATTGTCELCQQTQA